jgi:2'-5' RNA ligase
MSHGQHFRLFIGIKIAPEIAEQLARLALPLKSFSVRLVPPADLHITLVPPWNESDVVETVEKLRVAVRDCQAFSLIFDRVAYGPNQRRPRLLWVECRATPPIARLKKVLLQAFGHANEKDRPFLPHVTLARMPREGRMIARRHPVDLQLSFTQIVDTVELFRSPQKGAEGYDVLASLPLNPATSAPR